jgi:hypothetical protein
MSLLSSHLLTAGQQGDAAPAWSPSLADADGSVPARLGGGKPSAAALCSPRRARPTRCGPLCGGTPQVCRPHACLRAGLRRRLEISDTVHALKPDGFSGKPADGMTASIPAASRLKALPPPTRTVTASSGECDLYSNPTHAQRPSSKLRDCCSLWERRTTERPTRIWMARCKLSNQAFLHKQAEAAIRPSGYNHARPPHHCR